MKQNSILKIILKRLERKKKLRSDNEVSLKFQNGKTHSEETKLKMRKPKKFVPKFKCPHCEKEYDAGNLKQHLKRVGYESSD